MRIQRKLIDSVVILVVILVANSLICDFVSSEELRRNPFKDWLPLKIVEQPEKNLTDEKPLITFQQEKPSFNPSLYTVEGLIWGAVKPKAIINGEIYTVGDKLGLAEIVAISKDGVKLEYDDKDYLITTKPVIKIKNSESTVKENQGGVR